MERLWHSLRARLQAQDTGDFAKLKAIDRELEARYKRCMAPLIVDLVGFSRTVKNEGTISALTSVIEVWDELWPLAERSGGIVLKSEADTLYSVFPDVPKAVGTAIQMADVLDECNDSIRSKKDMRTKFFCSCIGIGWGETYLIGNENAFGEEVNYAYNLGENIAKAGDILLTENANKELIGISIAGVAGTIRVAIGKNGKELSPPYKSTDVAFFTWRVKRIAGCSR